jgi:serine/threonine protein kinase
MSLKLDEYTKDQNLKSLIKGLLHPNPEMRITNFREIKNSPWLSDIDWKKIE